MSATKKAGPKGSATFDPWNATFEEARAAQPATFDPGPLQPLYQWLAVQQIQELRKSCERGDGFSVMQCVHLCAWYGLVMPDWLAGDFLRRYRQVANARAGTWDEAFGRPYPKGAHLSRIRTRRRARIAINVDVVRAVQMDPDRAIDEGLFVEIGTKHGTGKTLTEELYRQSLQMGCVDAADMKRRLAGNSRRPANSKKLPGTKIRR